MAISIVDSFPVDNFGNFSNFPFCTDLAISPFVFHSYDLSKSKTRCPKYTLPEIYKLYFLYV